MAFKRLSESARSRISQSARKDPNLIPKVKNITAACVTLILWYADYLKDVANGLSELPTALDYIYNTNQTQAANKTSNTTFFGSGQVFLCTYFGRAI